MSRKVDIIILQETHGEPEDLHELRKLYPSWKIVGSFLGTAGAGGILFMVHERLAVRFNRFRLAPVVPGRIGILRMYGEFGNLD
eukprot:8314101-Pyramimonas_sp.AAC.1